jgi:hypothetical protein
VSKTIVNYVLQLSSSKLIKKYTIKKCNFLDDVGVGGAEQLAYLLELVDRSNLCRPPWWRRPPYHPWPPLPAGSNPWHSSSIVDRKSKGRRATIAAARYRLGGRDLREGSRSERGQYLREGAPQPGLRADIGVRVLPRCWHWPTTPCLDWLCRGVWVDKKKDLKDVFAKPPFRYYFGIGWSIILCAPDITIHIVVVIYANRS